jgi:hypothetical protein
MPGLILRRNASLLHLWAPALVASKTKSMSANTAWRVRPSTPFVGGRDAHPLRAGKAVRGRVDADHDRPFPGVCDVAQDLDHQVGADVAGTDDGDFEFCRVHTASP